MTHMVVGPLMITCTELYIVFKGDEAYVQMESKYCKTKYPFMRNVNPYKLDESISNLRVVGWSFSSLFKFKKTLP